MFFFLLSLLECSTSNACACVVECFLSSTCACVVTQEFYLAGSSCVFLSLFKCSIPSACVQVFHTQCLCQCCDPRVLFVLCAGLELEECPVLKTPPKEIRAKGFLSTYAFLKRLLSGSVECKRTKLMMVGLGGAGKTR